ncbi:MAG: glycosyltransferase [Oscillospiraceae bacterium]|nr:glycosyltransferase [Oscillospiraceae bacterium]
MKKILHVLPSLSCGGTEAFIMNYYRELQASEICFDFAVFSLERAVHKEEIIQNGGRVIVLGNPTVKNMLSFLRCAAKAMVENGPYDAIHCHANNANAWILMAAKFAGIPIRVSHLHSSKHREDKIAKKIYMGLQVILLKQLATQHMACSLKVGESYFGERYYSLHGMTFPNAIDVQRFQMEVDCDTCMLEELEIPEQAHPIVGYMARFDYNKNPCFAVEVFSRLLSHFPETILIMGGPDSGLLEKAQRTVSELGIEKKVRFIGPRSDVEKCLQAFDIFLSPTIDEGFGISLLEAQAAGCLCVASTGTPDCVDVGTGQIMFIPLELGAGYWADTIAAGWRRYKAPSSKAILESFQECGYDITQSAKKMLSIYCGNSLMENR